ncbi:MAG: DMT family transporter [Actinomycetota bacterium]|nr:DMT family transporter [Actinomycetota bacterium]
MSEPAPTGSGRSDLVGIGLAILGAVAFGTLAIFAKQAYAAGAQAIPLLALRFTVTSVLLVALHAVTRRPMWLGGRRTSRLLLLGGIGYGLESALFFLALERAPASVVGLVFYSYPIWTTLLAIALRLERFERRLALALAVGATGVASIFSLTSTPLVGPLLALGAAVVVAIFYIGAQLLSSGTPPATAATWTAIGAALSLAAVTSALRVGLPSEALVPAVGLGVATAIAFISTYAAIARIGSSRTSIANMMELVTTIALATILLAEELTLRLVIGATLVLLAIPILASKKREALPAADAA